MYHISLCTSIPNSIPNSIGPTLLRRVQALCHSITTHHTCHSPSLSNHPSHPSLSIIIRPPVTPHHTPSLHFIFRHFLHFLSSLHFPSSFTIFRLHCNLDYVPSSGYDPYPYQLSPPFIILGLVDLIIFWYFLGLTISLIVFTDTWLFWLVITSYFLVITYDYYLFPLSI